MSELIKRLITAMTLCLTALLVYAQEWTKEDSLRLRKLLDSDQELNRFPKHCLNRKWY